MRTNIVLNDELVNEAFKLTNAKTKKELVTIALKALIKQKKMKNIQDIKGKISFDENYDYKAMRN